MGQLKAKLSITAVIAPRYDQKFAKGAQVRTFSKSAVIPASGLVEGLAPVDVLGGNTQGVEHITSH